MIKKSLQIKKLESTSPEKFSFIASTDSVDRYMDVVEQNWTLEAYKNNPIVLFNHDQQALPIGKGEVRVENNQLLIDVEFDMEDATAAEIARKTKAGFLNAVSVGFQPLEFIPRSDLPSDHKHAGAAGNLYTKSELLEVSIVTVPAQPEATAAKGFNFDDFTGMLKTKSAIYMRRNILNSIKKHILYVEEADDKWVVHFAKGEVAEEAPEEEIEEESFLDEFLKADEYDEEEDDEKEEKGSNGGMGDGDDEEEEKEEDEEKNFNHALLRALTLLKV